MKMTLVLCMALSLCAAPLVVSGFAQNPHALSISKEFYDSNYKAAIRGEAAAEANLGIFYYEGTGVARDYDQAFKWLTRAANKGNTKAQYNLAILYEKGEGTTPNPKLAAEWFEKAALKGNAKAQFYLGMLYHNGNGVEKNLVKAYAWISAAISQSTIEETHLHYALAVKESIKGQLNRMEFDEAQKLSAHYLEKYKINM